MHQISKVNFEELGWLSPKSHFLLYNHVDWRLLLGDLVVALWEVGVGVLLQLCTITCLQVLRRCLVATFCFLFWLKLV